MTTKYLAGVLLFLCALFSVPRLNAQTPTFVEAGSWSGSGPGNGQRGRTSQLDPCIAGDLTLIGSQFGAGSGATSSSWTNDRSNTFTAVVAQPGNTDAKQVVNLFYNSSCTSGASVLTMSITGGSPSYVDSQAMVFDNASAFDVGCHNTGTGARASCSMRTTASHDLVACYVVEDSTTLSAPGFTPGGSFRLDVIDLISDRPQAMMHEVQPSAGAITPSATLSTRSTWNIVCGSWKAVRQGGVPSGIHVAHFVGMNLGERGATSYTNYPFPTSGNFLAVASQTGSNDTLCTNGTPNCVTDSNGNSWATCGGTGQGLVGFNNSQLYCTRSGDATTSSNMKINFSRSASAAADFFVWYDIAGAGALDQRRTATGDQATAGTVRTESVTPTTNGGMTIWTMGVATNTVPGVSSPPGVIFDCPVENPTEQDDPGCQNNGGGAHYYNSSTTTQTWIAKKAAENQAYTDWFSIAVTITAGSSDPRKPLRQRSLP